MEKEHKTPRLGRKGVCAIGMIVGAMGAAIFCLGIGLIYMPAGVIAVGLMLGITGISVAAIDEEGGDGNG